jgi:hypothetical protein
MPYRIAGIDVHKKMLAVVVADVEVDGDFHFERHKVGTTPADLHGLADWFVEHGIEEVVMESTARSPHLSTSPRRRVGSYPRRARRG